MAIRLGSWGLPEFGITEKIQSVLAPKKAATASGGSNLVGKSSAYTPPAYSPPRQSIAPIQSTGGAPSTSGSVLGASYGGGGGGAQAPMAPAGNQTLENNINQQTDDFSSQIESDFNTQMGALQGQEDSLNRQATGAIDQSTAQAGEARTELANTQATNIAGLGAQEQTAQKQKAGSLQQARDLFRQTQQQNIAQLSGLGISSSSVSEALAEKLGVETARRIAGVTGSTDEVIQNIAGEKTRVNTYFQQKMSDLENSLKVSTDNIRASLLDGISQINTARNQAANDKAKQRMELYSNAQSAIANLQANAQNFQQQMTLWNQQKSSALESAKQFVVTPTDFSGLTAAAQGVNAIGAAGLTGYQPSFAVSPQGKVSTTYNKAKTNDEDIVNPFQ